MVTDADTGRRGQGAAAGGRRRVPTDVLMAGDEVPALVELDAVTKIYRLGDVEVQALRGVSLAIDSRASSSRSWARRARASRR